MGNSIYTWDMVQQIVEHPHLLGHLAGKNLLEETHSDWIKWIHNTKDDRILQASRGSYKTTAISEIGTMYRLLRKPEETICLVRKSYSAAAEVVRAIMGMMELPQVYELFRFVWFADKYGNVPNNAEWHFDIRKEGKINLSIRKNKTPECTVEALGLDSRIIGRHYSYCLMDDVTDVKDRLYPSEREYTKTIVGELRANIVNRDGNSSIIGTAWHREDALTILKASGVPYKVYPYKDLPFISAEHIEEARKAQTPELFDCNYNISFSNSADAMFRDPYKQKWDSDKVKNVVCHVDAAYSNTGDYTAITIAGDLGNGKMAAIGFAQQKHCGDMIPFILEKANLYGAKTIIAEDNADRGFFLKLVADHPLARIYGIFTQGYNESLNKEMKISTYAYQKWKNIAWDESTDDDYMNMILDYSPASKGHDDAPDSLASVIREGNFGIEDSLALYDY